MTIGEIAKRAGLPVKTVRYYADIGLVEAQGRTVTGYRVYDERALRKLIFVRRSRAMGFSIEKCRRLLDLFQDQTRSSADVRAIAQNRLAEIEEKIDELTQLKIELTLLVDSCHGDSRPDCPILNALEQG